MNEVCGDAQSVAFSSDVVVFEGCEALLATLSFVSSQFSKPLSRQRLIIARPSLAQSPKAAYGLCVLLYRPTLSIEVDIV